MKVVEEALQNGNVVFIFQGDFGTGCVTPVNHRCDAFRSSELLLLSFFQIIFILPLYKPHLKFGVRRIVIIIRFGAGIIQQYVYLVKVSLKKKKQRYCLTFLFAPLPFECIPSRDV